VLNVQEMQGRQERAPRGLLTADEVQQLLDIDRSTIYRMAGDGRLPAVKIGRQWRFPADRIAALRRFGDVYALCLDEMAELSRRVDRLRERYLAASES